MTSTSVCIKVLIKNACLRSQDHYLPLRVTWRVPNAIKAAADPDIFAYISSSVSQSRLKLLLSLLYESGKNSCGILTKAAGKVGAERKSRLWHHCRSRLESIFLAFSQHKAADWDWFPARCQSNALKGLKKLASMSAVPRCEIYCTFYQRRILEFGVPGAILIFTSSKEVMKWSL